MLIRPFIAHLTQAEIHQIMCSGFATIAGSVLLAYISLGVNAQALISSCVMSIPASLAISKLRYPVRLLSNVFFVINAYRGVFDIALLPAWATWLSIYTMSQSSIDCL